MTIKIREVLTWDLPKLSLEVAQKLAKCELKTIDEFHQKVRDAVRSEASSELQVRCDHAMPPRERRLYVALMRNHARHEHAP